MSKTSVVVLSLLIFACGDNGKKERSTTPRIKKETKLVSPKQNLRISPDESVTFEIKSKNVSIDSIVIEGDGLKSTFTENKFVAQIVSKRVGKQRIKLTSYFGEKKETLYSKVIVIPTEAPAELTYEVVNTFPHDPDDYTQGLLIADGFLYESTGQTGKSALKKKNITTGEVIEQLNLSDDLFGEGLALIDDKLYQLTYTTGACFVYDMNFEKLGSFNYQGEGWGLTQYNGNLLMTNSSEKIFIRETSNFTVIDEFEVYDNNGKIESINEMEVIDGKIYANIYQKDIIVVIDPESGAVEQRIDMDGLLTAQENSKADVLNGIAFDQKNNRIFVTGKLWPKLFEVKFIPKNSL
jgi:glutamine cyclotransferase